MLQYGEARVISEGPVRAGTRIHHTGKGVLRWLKSAAEITTYDPPYHLATREEASGCMSGTATYRFELEPAEQGTNVTLIMEGAYKGWARVFFLLFSQSQLMKDQMSRSAQIRLSQLKNRLEASASPGKASLPDLSARLAEQEQAGFETFSTQTTTKQYRLSSMLIRMQPRDLVSLPGESTRRHLFFLTPFLLAALALFGFALKDFWRDWQNAQWNDVSFYQLGLIFMGLIGLWIGQWLRGRGWRPAFAAQAVRQFVSQGDERVAPLAMQQPPTQPEAPLAQLAQGLRLKQFIDPQSRLRYLGNLILVACMLIPLSFLGSLFGPAFFIVAVSLLVLLGIAAGVLLWRWRQPLIVQADNLGLRWKARSWWSSAEKSMAWSQAEAFFTFTRPSSGLMRAGEHRFYALASPAAILAWEGPPTARGEQQQAHDWLCYLVARHTQRPLRDVSACLGVPPEQSISGFLAHSLRFADVFVSLPRPRRTWRSWVWSGAWLTPLLLVGLLYGASWGLSRYETSSYDKLLKQIESHAPIYHDALAAPDGNWPVQSSSADGQSTFTYVNGEYRMTGGPDGYYITAAPEGTYTNAAVEVTVRILGPDKYYDAGLLLHAHGDENGDLLNFTVSPSGDWQISHFQGDTVGASLSGYLSNGLIHTGLGAANRLAVLMQDDQYICYINGQLVGILRDASAPYGLVGLYLGDTKATAAFSDFTVYPV